MSHPFEQLPTTPLADELVDKAFSRGARAGRAKSGIDAQHSMLQTAANIISDNLENVVTAWPDFDHLHPFYRNLADAVVGVDSLRKNLNEINWASTKATDLRKEYESRLYKSDLETATKLRKQAYARLADVVEEIADDLEALMDAREALRVLPDIRPDHPTIVVAGYPNVGKSSFVNAVTRASNREASYPFTTTQVHVGHVEHKHMNHQLVDTPGLLDRPPEERNEVESQAINALEHAADAVLVILDPSLDCGYPLDMQRALRDDIEARFDVPVISIYNKIDRLDPEEREKLVAEEQERVAGTELTFDPETNLMSVTEDENVQTVLDRALDAVGYEPELPVDGDR